MDYTAYNIDYTTFDVIYNSSVQYVVFNTQCHVTYIMHIVQYITNVTLSHKKPDQDNPPTLFVFAQFNVFLFLIQRRVNVIINSNKLYAHRVLLCTRH